MYIITGGGSGVGRALALALAAYQKPVLIVGRRIACLEQTAKASSFIEYLCADISTQEGLDLVLNRTQTLPPIDGLINNAGTLNPLVSLKELSFSDWHQSFKINLDAPFILSQKLFEKLSHGRVLNIGSGAAYFPIKGWAAYCVTKAALSMLTQCWQLESDTVAFSSVMPGIINTDMQSLARSGHAMDASQVAFYKQLKARNSLVEPEVVAAFLVWLLLEVDSTTYSSKEWDIYDTTHHTRWLKPPHQVPHWES